MTVLPGFKYLEAVPERRGGKPTVKGTRVSVEDILEALSNGWSIDEVADNFEIPREAVLEALKYAAEVLKRIEVLPIEASS